jgi:ATP-dependent DNA helicase DinG
MCQNEESIPATFATPVIEAEVHQQLRAFLREQGDPAWPHHLTLARLVARALRLNRSALLQTGSAAAYHGRYRLSYLMSVLLWPGPVVLVVPQLVRQQLLLVDLPRLREWMPSYKPVQSGDRWPDQNFTGLLITSPEAWLADRLGDQSRFPSGIPTLLDGVDDLENWVRTQLTVSISSADWEALTLAYPDQQNLIRDTRVQLTHAAFQHPDNPYQCHLLESPEQTLLQTLQQELVGHHPQPIQAAAAMPPVWQAFWQQFAVDQRLLWLSLDRLRGQFQLHCGPIDLAARLQPLWAQQPLVLMGAALDQETQATAYRQRLGLGDMTCLKFAPDRQNELIQLYLPERLPLPNTPQFQAALQSEIRQLLFLAAAAAKMTVILVGDSPLKAQLGAVLAAEFGSRVQVERTQLGPQSILVSGWDFWQAHQVTLPAPALLIVTTLPIPSLEDPLVAARVAYYKAQRQDWFRLYLLPTALNVLQRAIASVREAQGGVALLDTRVHYRSYGHQVIEALGPAACVRLLHSSWPAEADLPS